MKSNHTFTLREDQVEIIRKRANSTGFESEEAYVQFIIDEVLHQLTDSVTSVEEVEVKERLESLGYVE